MEIYLITGASGHLGSTLVEKLILENKKVRVLLIENDPFPFPFKKNVEIVYGDVSDISTLPPFFANPNNSKLIVIHCAGIVSIESKINTKLYNVNVIGTKNMLEMAKQHNVSRFIYVSSVHAIPELPNKGVMSEIYHFDPALVVGAYAKTKAEATQLALDSAKDGLNISIVHPSGISGPNDRGKSHMTQVIIDYYKGKLTAIVKGGYDFVDVRDVADGIISCVDKGRPGEAYILSNHYFSIGEIVAMLHKITKKRKIRTILPMWFVKLTAPLSELFYRLLRRPPLYTVYSLYTLSSNSNFSNEKAKKELGFKTRPFEKTLRDSVAWLKANDRL